ncbi:GreA/GreB family elongation factor [Paenibacillus sp. MBLB4367]|uniref:GreA/GreB family elongation factor n=1 Tax=Paenibacillus sp. MBLB4367 TaxID=3384767 RepID=UPI003907EEA5
MNHSLTGAKTQLIKQLVYFDEEVSHFLDLYIPVNGSERTKTEQLLVKYAAALNGLLPSFSEETLHSIALIGSKVQIRYLDDNEVDEYVIVFPSNADPNRNRISFLSPIGSHLLLGAADERHAIETPSGLLQVKIESIRYMNFGEI